MSPFGPYADFGTCVAENSDKSNPEAFCAWLHHKITGAWPGEFAADQYPEIFWTMYDKALSANKTEKEAYQSAVTTTEAAGWNQTRFGWVKEFQAPEMKMVTGVRIFGEGTWTDSAGYEKTWNAEDLQAMKKAFDAGVPAVVPLKCGHTSDEFNKKIAEALGVPVEVVTGEHGQGQISIGKAIAFQIKGRWILSSFDKVPEPIANLIEGGQYSTISVEIEDTVGEYGPVITGVALLGAEEPAVEGATLERALVFGGSRKGARVYSFQVGDDIPVSELKAEYDDIRAKLAEIVKGKRGAPIFRALFGNLTDLFEKIVGKGNERKGDKLDFHTTEERMRGLRWAAQELGLPDDASIDQVIAALQELKTADQVPEEVRAYADQEFQGNVDALIAWVGRVGYDNCVSSLTGKPGVSDPVKVCGWLKGRAHTHSEEGGKHEMELAVLAKMLGLGEEATEEDVMAALQALIEKAAETAPPVGEKSGDKGELADQLKAATDQIAELRSELDGQKSLSAWKEKTAKLTSIPGTTEEIAVGLAEIEAAAGKDAAEKQFVALDGANTLTENATKIVGTSRSGEQTDFDNEVKKFMDANPDKSKTEAIDAVSKEHPDLYFARRDSWHQ